MPVEFIGMIGTQDESEIRPSAGPVIDPDYVRRFARAHEDTGFDRVLIGYSSTRPDGTQVAAYAAAQTDRLSFLVAHRPGFVAPTLAARTFATLDQFTGGRIAVHIITGGSDAEQRRDGDHLSKDERYARTDEYLDIVKAAWTSETAFSYPGKYYQIGVTTILIRGYDPYDDAIDYGRYLLPLVREEVARRDCEQRVAEAAKAATA
jgi:alkanesulfonate monooxygenase